MSRFFSSRYAELTPYVPGEQPIDQPYIKLNTNESPFPPPPGVAEALAAEADRLRLYSDTECTQLRSILSERLGVSPNELLMTNGSDEILNFAFMAFCDEQTPAIFPDITYGFYPVFAAINRISFREIPLTADWRIDLEAFCLAEGTVFLANPNAPTGIALGRDEIERVIRANPDHVVVVDEAYVDFGAESCVPLIHQYDNLLVTQTFSKSRSMAGARLGFGVGCESLIRDLNTVKFSTNPYNVNRATQAAGIACLREDDYNMENCRRIQETRSWTAEELRKLGFRILDSWTNFLFAEHAAIDGETLYRKLKERGILIRHFSLPRIRNYNRITIGTREQMEALIRVTGDILEEAR